MQEAYTRLHALPARPDEPAAWLTTVVSRLAIDHLRSARVQREAYIGPWLPEPVEGDADDPEQDAVLAESISLAMLVVLETLSPLERAVFVLHDVFGYPYLEVADMIDRSAVAARQAGSRARRRVQARRPRFAVDPATRRAVAQGFLAAAEGADLGRLMDVLAPDVVFRSDGGGVVPASRKIIRGAEDTVRVLTGLRRLAPDAPLTLGWVNESPAVLVRLDGQLDLIIVLHVSDDGCVVELNAIRNPAKLVGFMPPEG